MTEEKYMNDNNIELYLHCGLCIEEKPNGISAKDWASIQAGWTKKGFQVWCNRHDINILHVDFEGVKHPADTTRYEPEQ